MRAALLLFCAGCVPTLERSPAASWAESDPVSLSAQEQWDLAWTRHLPEILATPPPEPPPEFATPELAAAWRKGAQRGREWALAEGMRLSIVCAFPKTDVERAASAGFDAGRKSIGAWCSRLRDEAFAFLVTTRRPADLELRGELPVILCFSRDVEGVAAASAREARRAVVAQAYTDDYPALAGRPDVLRVLLARALEPARPGALYLVATSESREALKDLELPRAWRSPDAIEGESDAAYLERAFRSLP